MKRYYISLVALTLLLAVISIIALQGGQGFMPILPLTALYFAIVTGVQHYIVVKAFDKSPRAFVKNFMGVTVGTLFLHIIAFAIYLLTHPQQAKVFAIGFCIAYAVYLVFETTSLALLIQRRRKQNNKADSTDQPAK